MQSKNRPSEGGLIPQMSAGEAGESLIYEAVKTTMTQLKKVTPRQENIHT